MALAKDLRAAGAKAGLAIDRDTPVEPYLELLPHLDTLLIMTIKAGFGGQTFMPEMLDKVRDVRRRHHRQGTWRCASRSTAGSRADTIEQAAEAGADAFVAGTAVYGADDPAEAVRKLRALADAAPRLRHEHRSGPAQRRRHRPRARGAPGRDPGRRRRRGHRPASSRSTSSCTASR